MRYIKSETAEKPLKTPKTLLDCCKSYYHERGGRQVKRDYYKNLPPEKIAARNASLKMWRIRNRDRVRILKFASNTKHRISKYRKDFDVWDMIGCDCAQLAVYLDSQCESGVDWRDGRRFNIDHIRPLCSFDLTRLDQIKEAFHFTNLQVIERGKHEEKSKPEHRTFMEMLATKWWIENRGTEYPGFLPAWRELSQRTIRER